MPFAIRTFFAALIAVILAVSTGAAMAEPRVALLIGNADYGDTLGKLANPVRDAKLMQRALEKAGFDVTLVTDADQKKMKRAISDFGKRLLAAGPEVTGLFYYSGHGVQVSGVNYLIPTEVDISSEADVDLEAVSADTIMRQMQYSGSRVNIVILDACRNNPLPKGFRSAQMGLARMDAPRGSFVAYSTAPGETASDGDTASANSPYTAALAAAIEKPGTPIEEAFRNVRGEVLRNTGNQQTPWESSSLTAPFYFLPPAEGGQAAATQGEGADARAIELTFWSSIQNSQDPADYQAYLEKYPNGNFVAIARNRFNMLTGINPTAPSSPPPAPAAEPAAEPPVEQPVEPGEEVASASAVGTPSDPAAAADICRSDDKSPEERLPACERALTQSNLDEAGRADLINELGRAHHDLQNYDAAEKAFSEAMRLNPQEPVYPANLALALGDAQKYADAIVALGRAIELAPKDVWNYYNRANDHLYLGDVAASVADLDAALKIDENFELLSARAYAALALGDDKNAGDFISRAITLDSSAYGLQSVAVLYYLERDKAALDMVDRVIADNKAYGYGQIWKAMLLTRAGKSGAARSLLNTSLKDHASDWPGMLMKWMLGKFDAETLLTKAKEGTDEDKRNQLCEANFYLGDRALAQGDKKKAAEYFSAALDTKVYNYIEYYAAAAFKRRAESE